MIQFYITTCLSDRKVKKKLRSYSYFLFHSEIKNSVIFYFSVSYIRFSQTIATIVFDFLLQPGLYAKENNFPSKFTGNYISNKAVLKENTAYILR